MKTYPAGKKIIARRPILTNGKPLPPAGRDPRLLPRTPRGTEIEMPFALEGNISPHVYRSRRATPRPRLALSDRYRLTRCENSVAMPLALEGNISPHVYRSPAPCPVRPLPPDALRKLGRDPLGARRQYPAPRLSQPGTVPCPTATA